MNGVTILRARRAFRGAPRVLALAACLVALDVGVSPALAQPEIHVPPLLDGRLVVGGEATATFGSDDGGFFNRTSYDVSLLRLAVVQLNGEWRLGEGASLVGELRTENDNGVRASAWFLRMTPAAGVPLVVEVGRIPHVFGQRSNRRYGHDNPVIGLPLAYQYLTSLRTDAVPATADALLRSRARGWTLAYPAGVGAVEAAPGVPLLAALRWDTGARATWNADGAFEAAVALTVGSLSKPRLDDDNGALMVSTRVVIRPTPGLSLGVSAARGAYLANVARRDVARVTGAETREWYQQAVGADVEVSHGHWLARAEVMTSRWDAPRVAAPRLPRHLEATTGMVEGRYRVHPRAWVAARAEHLWFSHITGTLFQGRPTAWDAPVTRVETGVGMFVTRQLECKVTYQLAWRDAGRVRRPRLVAAQLAFWF